MARAHPRDASKACRVDGELNCELARRSGTSAKCRGRGPEGGRQVVRVREVPGVRADSPPTITGAVLDADAEKAIGTLSLDIVIERCVEHFRLSRRVSRDR